MRRGRRLAGWNRADWLVQIADPIYLISSIDGFRIAGNSEAGLAQTICANQPEKPRSRQLACTLNNLLSSL